MGEMADFVNDDTPPDDSPLYEYEGTITCRNCGAGPFHWGLNEKDQWRLVDFEGRKHVCPVVPAPEDRQIAK